MRTASQFPYPQAERTVACPRPFLTLKSMGFHGLFRLGRREFMTLGKVQNNEFSIARPASRPPRQLLQVCRSLWFFRKPPCSRRKALLDG